ncbi:MAG: hypothetical protein ACYS7Y_19170 [Planctomycetota bacterium]|jgi:hypothetical protein
MRWPRFLFTLFCIAIFDVAFLACHKAGMNVAASVAGLGLAVVPLVYIYTELRRLP